jgi:hypothetical protein
LPPTVGQLKEEKKEEKRMEKERGRNNIVEKDAKK